MHIEKVSQALSDPARLVILRLLAGVKADAAQDCCLPAAGPSGTMCVCFIAGALETGQSRASYHLKILKEADLITEHPSGKWTYYGLNRQTILRYAETIVNGLIIQGEEKWQNAVCVNP